MSALEIQTTVMQMLFAPIHKDLSSAHAGMGSRGMESPAQVSAVSFPYSYGLGTETTCMYLATRTFSHVRNTYSRRL